MYGNLSTTTATSEINENVESMSRFLTTNRNIELLEPYEGKLSCTVLRGERGSNVPDLPDFIRERYRPATGEGDMSFLSRSYERHFNERPFLTHACFLYLTKTTRERMHMRSDFSTLCRGNIIPKEVNREAATKFLEAAEQFERILNDSGFLTLVRLTGDEITGTADCPGLLERYFSLSLSETTSPQDIELGAEVLRVGNKRVCLHTLSDTEDLPGRVTSVFPPTVRTACSRSRPPWGFCFPATTFTTSTCSWKTATKTCVCSRNVRVTCSPFPATPAGTR